MTQKIRVHHQNQESEVVEAHCVLDETGFFAAYTKNNMLNIAVSDDGLWQHVLVFHPSFAKEVIASLKSAAGRWIN